MSRWKRLAMTTLSTSILLTQGGPLPYLAYAVEAVNQAAINGEVKFSWITDDKVSIGSTFNPYDGLQAIDADGDNVAVLAQIDGDVDTSRAGLYPITYSITNVDGETFNITRQIEVIETDYVNNNNNAEELPNDDNSDEVTEEELPNDDNSDEVTEGELPNDDNSDGVQSAHPQSLLDDVVWTLYDRSEKKELIKFSLNTETGYYESHISEMLQPLLEKIRKDDLNLEVLHLKIFSENVNERFSMTFTVRDLLDKENILKKLKEIKYEIGDQISVIPTSNEKTILVVNGIISGDISKEQGGYETGVTNEDYLHNVRFQLMENGLNTMYNEAPVIHGLEDIDVTSKEEIDPLKGIFISDDKDNNLSLDMIDVKVENESDDAITYRYTITDSWKRSTTGTRQVRIVSSGAYDIPITHDSTGMSSLQNTLIHVGGRPYIGDSSNDLSTRFKIHFDTVSKEIKLVDQDGRMMNPSYRDNPYFKFELFDKNMNLKTSVTLTGKDTSDSEKLNKIKNYIYEIGDYVSLWHIKTDTSDNNQEKLKITGSPVINGNETVNYNNGIPYFESTQQRYQITKNGLAIITNQAPMLKEGDVESDRLDDLTLTLNQTVNLVQLLRDKISDDKDHVNNLTITHSDFSTAAVGNYTVLYTVIDSWGATLELEQQINIISNNPLNNTYFEVYTKNQELAFTMTFNTLDNKLVLSNSFNKQLDSNNEGTVFRLKVIRDNVIQRSLSLKGTDMSENIVRSKLHGYKYEIGDQIEIWSNYPDTGIKIKGNIHGIPENGEDYSNGIQNIDAMNNVRFEIKESGFVDGDNSDPQALEKNNWLQYVYNAAPVFGKLEPIIIKRTETPNYLLGVTVNDEDEDILSQVTHSTLTPEQLNTAGTYEIRYQVTDSWGRSSNIVRPVVVQPYAQLEQQKVNVFIPYEDELLFTLGFDENYSNVNNNLETTERESINSNNTNLSPSKQKRIRIDNFNPLSSSSTSEDVIIIVGLYNKNGVNKQMIQLNRRMLTNSDWISKIESWTYESTDYISVCSVDYKGIVIESSSGLTSDLNDISGNIESNFRFESEDQMKNTRFQLSSTGLVYKYNGAPIFNGLEPLYLYKNSIVTEEVLKQNVTVDDEDQNLKFTITGDQDIETGTIGNYQIVYQVTDSWNRTTQQTRQVSVISKATENTVDLYNEQNQKFLMLRYNPIKNGFDVTTYISENHGETPTIIDGEGSGDVKSSDPLFTISIFNQDHKEIHKLLITAENWKDENFFDDFEEVEVQHGYYFNIFANDPSKVKINGSIQIDENIDSNIDYGQGVLDSDVLINVRFKLTEDGLDTLYNKAPEIVFDSNYNFSALAGDPIDYIAGVRVTDDHDLEIPSSNIIISYGEDKTENDLIIGANTIFYSVTDSWGHPTTVERELIISNGVSKNEISLYSYETGPNREDEEYVSIRLQDDGTRTGGTFNVTTVDKIFNEVLNGGKNFEFTLLNAENQQKHHILAIGSAKATIFNSLNNVKFKYGDKIKIFAWHPVRVKMGGLIANSREDYSNGFDNPQNLLNTVFEITPSGLKAIYTESHVTSENQNIFAPIAPEGIPFKLKFTPNTDSPTGTIELITNNDYSILYGTNDKVLEVWLYSADGNEKKHITAIGNDRPHKITGLNDFNRLQYNIGDYLKVWHKDPSRMTIYGDVKNQKENYDDGFNDEDSVRYTVFKLNADGFEAIYNEAPTIIGAENKDIILGQNFNPLEGIMVHDDHDNLTLTIDHVTGNINPYQLGEQQLTYTITDSWGKQTSLTRIITVRSQLDFNSFQVYSATNNEIPVFEIGFDSLNNQYRIFNQTTERLDPNNPSEEIVKIEIRRNSSKNDKILHTITLTGNDRGNSIKLNVLNELEYQEGDIIRVYHRDIESGITFKNNGTEWSPDYSPVDSELMSPLVLMKNTGFKIISEDLEINNHPVAKPRANYDEKTVTGDSGLKQTKLEAIYNNAPNIQGYSPSQTILKGTTLNLVNNILVTDELDTIIHNSNVIVTVNDEIISNSNLNYTFNHTGDYTVTYRVTDSWGRTTQVVSNIKVQSKSKENTIDVYGPDNILAFKVTFNTDNNQFILTEISNSNKSDLSLLTSEPYFEMIVRSMNGTPKYTVQLTDDVEHNKQQLKKLHAKSFELYDTIALKSTSPTAIKISGDIVGKSSTHDYSNGFQNVEHYSEVRFQITDDGLKEMNRPILTINPILSDITLTRGETIDFEEIVTIGGLPENSDDFQLTFDSSQLNIFLEGTYKIPYTVTTSWNTNVTHEVNIIVTSRNKLEENRLELYNRFDEKVLSIGFDTLNGNLRVIESKQENIDGTNPNTVLRLSAYDNSGNIINSLELTGNVAITDTVIQQIENFSYQDISMLGVWAQTPKSLIISGSIEGDVTLNQENYADGIDDINYMNNVRFKISDNGLKSVYNYAPVINISSIHDDMLTMYKGSTLEMPLGISVTDDHDKTISSSVVSINDSEVDYDKIGIAQQLYFEAEDSWGRVGSKQVSLIILPPLEHTKIKILPLGVTSKALVINFTSDSKINFSEEYAPLSIQQMKAANNEESITIKLYHYSQKVNEVTLNSNNMEEEISKLMSQSWSFRPGGNDYLAFEGVSQEVQKNIQIHGSVNSGKLDYSEGLKDIELDNTRFKLSDLGIETIYNEAPIIQILPNDKESMSTTISALKGDVIDFGYNVILEDDHDELDFESHVTVTHLPQDNAKTKTNNKVDDIFSTGKLGSNIVQYTVTDSWGRTATTTREIILDNGLSQVQIQLFGHKIDETPDIMTDLAVTLTFDILTNTIQLTKSSENLYFNKGNNFNKQYQIYLKDGTSNRQKDSFFVYGASQTDHDSEIKKWIKTPPIFEYGDYLELVAWHQDTLKIQGPVRNALEDYSDGVQLGDSYTKVRFRITESGLEAEYNDDYIPANSNQNLIMLSSREGLPMQIRLIPNSSSPEYHYIQFEKLTSYSIQYTTDSTWNSTAFRLTMYNNQGEKISTLKMTKNDNPTTNKNKLLTFIRELNEHTQQNPTGELTGTYGEGYYLEVAHITPNYVRIKGNIQNAVENYDDGIDNRDHMENVVFKLTSNGMECLYISAPKITGVKNLEYPFGSQISESELRQELLDGIEVNGINFEETLIGDNPIGSIDYSSLDYSQTTYFKKSLPIDKIYQLDQIGFYDVIYTYGGSNDSNTSFLDMDINHLNKKPKRTVFKRATINIYDSPTIEKSGQPTVIQAGDLRTEDECKKWLSSLVTTTDLDDQDIPVNLEITYNENHPFNPSKAGEYEITYIATDSGNHSSTYTLIVSVVRTISVSVPHNLPFQVVTNLIAGNEDSPFIAGVLKFTSNTLTPVDVYIKSITKVVNSGNLTLVSPYTFSDWSTISEENTMSKMALGIYQKDGFTDNTYTKDKPFWLIPDEVTNNYIGTLPSKERGAEEPAIGRLTFTAKHGEIFNFGKTNGQFKISFEFR